MYALAANSGNLQVGVVPFARDQCLMYAEAGYQWAGLCGKVVLIACSGVFANSGSLQVEGVPCSGRGGLWVLMGSS